MLPGKSSLAYVALVPGSFAFFSASTTAFVKAPPTLEVKDQTPMCSPWRAIHTVALQFSRENTQTPFKNTPEMLLSCFVLFFMHLN